MKTNNTFDNFQYEAMRNDPRNYKWGLFYFNRKDPRIMVPKRFAGLGWTMNFAHPVTYVIMGALILLPILISILDKVMR